MKLNKFLQYLYYAVIPAVLGYFSFKLCTALQSYFFVESGEIIYNSAHLIVFSIIVWLFTAFLLVLLEPYIWSSKRKDVEAGRQEEDIAAQRQRKLIRWVTIGLGIMLIIFFGSFFNYIKLSESQIFASSWGWWPNEKAYNYEDVKIEYPQNKNENYYIFTFPDGKRVLQLFNENEIAEKISEKTKHPTSQIITVVPQNFFGGSIYRIFVQALMLVGLVWVFRWLGIRVPTK